MQRFLEENAKKLLQLPKIQDIKGVLVLVSTINLQNILIIQGTKYREL